MRHTVALVLVRKRYTCLLDPCADKVFNLMPEVVCSLLNKNCWKLIVWNECITIWILFFG